MRKAFRIAGIIALSIPLLLVLGLVIWSAVGTYPSGDVAARAMQSDTRVTVTRGRYISFEPSDPVLAETGIIFYPGGLVEPEAYAPVLKAMADQGIRVFLTPMPLNLAILRSGAARRVLRDHPEIRSWYLAGHSLGGASAGIFAASNPELLDGYITWDSYPPASSDLSSSGLRSLSIYGTSGGEANTPNFDEQRQLMPQQTVYAPIEGGSHAQFGDYGPQAGDVTPRISLAEQHTIILDLMMDFILSAP